MGESRSSGEKGQKLSKVGDWGINGRNKAPARPQKCPAMMLGEGEYGRRKEWLQVAVLKVKHILFVLKIGVYSVAEADKKVREA